MQIDLGHASKNHALEVIVTLILFNEKRDIWEVGEKICNIKVCADMTGELIKQTFRSNVVVVYRHLWWI